MEKTDDKNIHNLNKCIDELIIPTNILNNYAETTDKIKRLCNEPLNLAIVGEFNAGKSSFINVLLGLGGLLPTSILPKTATITKLKYDEKFSVEIVENKDGNIIIEKSDDKEILKKYQNAKDIDEDYKNDIQEIVIKSDNVILKNFTFIDTPGFNHDEKMSNLTRSIYPDVDIFIWLMTATQIASETQIKELEELEKLKKEVFFIVNKSDLSSEEDEEQIEQYLKDQLPLSFKESKIYFLSSEENYIGKYKNNLDIFRIDLKEKALNRDIEVTTNLLKIELSKLKTQIENEILKYNNDKANLVALNVRLKSIKVMKGLEFVEYKDRARRLSDKITSINKEIENIKTKYKKVEYFLKKYILEEKFNEEIIAIINKYFTPTGDKISKYSKEIKEFIEKKDMKDFKESEQLLKFIDESLIHIRKNIYPFGVKGMIYNKLVSDFGKISINEEILEEIYMMDEITAFKFTIDYMDELLYELDNTLDSNIESSKSLEEQINKFEWSKDAL